MTYTVAAFVGALVAVAIDLVVLRTRLLGRAVFWASYAIVLFFQLIVNGLLTGIPVVRYDSTQILGPRVVFAPLEDLFFGFAMVLVTLALWVWTGRSAAGTAALPVSGPATPPAAR